jgi:hypothetical protein
MMTDGDRAMLTMKIIKLLGIAGIAILAASFMAARELKEWKRIWRKIITHKVSGKPKNMTEAYD